MTLEALRYALLGVSAYRNMMDEPLMREVSALLDAVSGGRGGEALERYAAVFYALRQEGYETLGGWLHDKLRYEDGPYPRLVERGGEDRELTGAAERDVEVLCQLSGLSGGLILSRIGALLPPEAAAVPARLPRWSGDVPFDFASLTEFYRRSGAGLFACNRAFLWEGGALRPVADPDCTGGGELIGYERQREQVIANTRAMMEGNLVNNVLLYGDPGTGKSVTVKSLLTVPGPVAMAAGLAQLRYLKDHPEIYTQIEDYAVLLAGGLREAAERTGAPVHINQAGSLLAPFFTPTDVNTFTDAKGSDVAMYARYFAGMLERGIYLAPAQFEAMFVSAAHTREELSRTLEAAGAVLSSLK